MNAVAYVRVSTDAQAGADRYGLDAQRADITAYAESHDMHITAWYEDTVSGATLDRPGESQAWQGRRRHTAHTAPRPREHWECKS